jgi:hypothetical protein
MDVEQYEWEELMDEDSADFFYWQEDTDHYTWTKPQIPHTKYQTKILPLEVGEKVTFLFPGKAREEEAIVTRIRKDDETGEDKYDIQHCRQESVRHQWIERYRLKKIAKTGEELKLALSAKEWKKQIRRQREKEKRIKLLIRQKKQQEELEKRSKVLVVKRHQTAGGGMSVASSQDEMEKGRILRSRVEKSQLEEERDAVIRQKRAEAIEAMMRDMNTGKMKLSKSEMISLQRSITMRLEVEGMRNKRTAAQNVSPLPSLSSSSAPSPLPSAGPVGETKGNQTKTGSLGAISASPGGPHDDPPLLCPKKITSSSSLRGAEADPWPSHLRVGLWGLGDVGSRTTGPPTELLQSTDRRMSVGMHEEVNRR